jgi:hypothetical protein
MGDLFRWMIRIFIATTKNASRGPWDHAVLENTVKAPGFAG